MPKRRLPLDTRLDWRDPNMPVLRYGVVEGVTGTHKVAPENITKYYKAKLEQLGWQMPDYKNDVSYWWNRKGKGK